MSAAIVTKCEPASLADMPQEIKIEIITMVVEPLTPTRPIQFRIRVGSSYWTRAPDGRKVKSGIVFWLDGFRSPWHIARLKEVYIACEGDPALTLQVYTCFRDTVLELEQRYSSTLQAAYQTSKEPEIQALTTLALFNPYEGLGAVIKHIDLMDFQSNHGFPKGRDFAPVIGNVARGFQQLQKLTLGVRSLRDIQPGYDNEERLRRQLAAMSEESFLNDKHDHDFEYPLKIMGLKNVARIFKKHGLSVKVICNVKFIWWMNNEKTVQNVFFDVSAKIWKVTDREWCDRDC